MGRRFTQASLPLLSKVNENDLFGCLGHNFVLRVKRLVMPCLMKFSSNISGPNISCYLRDEAVHWEPEANSFLY